MDATTKVATAAMMNYQNRLKSTGLSVLVKEKKQSTSYLYSTVLFLAWQVSQDSKTMLSDDVGTAVQ